MNDLSIKTCDTNCGLFDFMANNMGIKVLHPGGYEATDLLCETLNMNQHATVLDLACGSGSTSFYLYQKYKCNVVGIDISENLIHIALNELSLKNIPDKIFFKVADALKLPFPDNSFDVIIAQAFFILIDEKDIALKEIYRVLKPGGYLGSLELSWYKPPTKKIYDELVQKTCQNFIPRVQLFEKWESFFLSGQFQHIRTIKKPVSSGMLQMLRSEGILNFMRVMIKMISDGSARKRMMGVQNTFKKSNDYLGYGIYCYRK